MVLVTGCGDVVLVWMWFMGSVIVNVAIVVVAVKPGKAGAALVLGPALLPT